MPPTVFVSKPVNFAMPWSSCTTALPALRSVKEAMAPRPAGVAASRVREGGEGAAARRRARRSLGPAAAQQPVLGEDRELEGRRQEAFTQRGGGERDARRGVRRLAVQEVGSQAAQVVG